MVRKKGEDINKSQVFYHATPAINLKSILKCGLMPRDFDFYRKLFCRITQEYGLDPGSIIRYDYKPKWLCKTVCKAAFGIGLGSENRISSVSLSGNDFYAFRNAWASTELEVEMRGACLSLKDGNSKKYYQYKQKAFEEILRKIGREIAILEVEDRGFNGYKNIPVKAISELRVSCVLPEQIKGYRLMSKLVDSPLAESWDS